MNLKPVAVILLIVAAVLVVCSFANFFSGEKQMAEEKIASYEKDRKTFESFKSTYLEYGGYDDAADMQKEIDAFDRLIREEQAVIDACNGNGYAFGGAAVVSVIVGLVCLFNTVKNTDSETNA